MEQLKVDYVTPGHPMFQGGRELLFRYYPNLSKQEIVRYLESNLTYTIKREAKSVVGFNPYWVWDKGKLLQIDLIDMSSDPEIVRANDGVKYLFCAIDTLTRFLYVVGMSSKRQQLTLDAYRSIKAAMGGPPQRILCDRGGEFTNALFQAELVRDNTVMIFPNYKAGTVERVQRSLQSLIYKHIEQMQTFRFIDVLQDLVKTYNTRRHRIIKMTPEEAEDDANLFQLRKNVGEYYTKATQKGSNKVKFLVGDIVRILANRGKFGRSYDHIFTQEVFKISNINTILAKPMYEVTNWRGDETIKGKFYARELQKVRGNIFKVKKVLKRRKIRGRPKEVYVSWVGYDDTWNEWILESDIYHSY